MDGNTISSFHTSSPCPQQACGAFPGLEAEAAQLCSHQVSSSSNIERDIWDEERSDSGMKAAVYYKLLSYFSYGWPDLYNSANPHCGVYRVKTGCAPACRSALSARGIFLGSCFHDKIFSDSIFAYEPLKVWFCLM